MHESLSRAEDELALKISNWGYYEEINSRFMKKWIHVNENNYKEYTDLYYVEPERWKKLNYFPSKNIKEILLFIEETNIFRLSTKSLLLKNFGQCFKFLSKK